MEISLTFNVFWAGNPRDCSGFFRRSICTHRELRRPKSNHVHLAFSCFFPFLLPQEYKNPPLTEPHKNLSSWDHAQMIERTILCRIALTRALYDQISSLLNPQYHPKHSTFRWNTKIHLQAKNAFWDGIPIWGWANCPCSQDMPSGVPVGGKENYDWSCLYLDWIQIGPI